MWMMGTPVIESQSYIIAPPGYAQAVVAFVHRRNALYSGVWVLQENSVSDNAVFPEGVVVFR